MKKEILTIIGIAAIVAGAVIYQYRNAFTLTPENKPTNADQNATTGTEQINNATGTTQTGASASTTISTFEQCVAAGKVVEGETPNRRCIVNDDLIYIEIQTCKTAGGESMNFFEAQRLFDASPCSLEGSAKPDPVCDQPAGTWRIEIQAYRINCNPICIINIATKTAQVDWRCTDAKPQ